MKISIIGVGGIARKYYLPILAARSELELQFFARSQLSVQQAQADYRVTESASSLAEVLRWKPDAAFVLTPSASHFDIVKTLLQQDIDVFVEKPATLSVDETRILAEMADLRGRILMVGFNRRFAPIHQRAREYWANRKVEQAVFTKFRTKPFHDTARNHLYDDTIHLVDTLRYFCGEGKVVHRELRVDDYFIGATAVIALAAGGIAQVVTSMRAGSWREEYLLAGDGLTLELQAFKALSISQGDEVRTWSETYDSGSDTATGRGFVHEIDYFLDCVRERKNPQTDAWDSMKTQILVEAIAGE